MKPYTQRPSRRASTSVLSYRLLFAALTLIPVLLSPAAKPHELPQRVALRMIASIDEQQLQLMIRAPLEAMRDVDFPLSPEGYLLLEDAQSALREAAGLWIVDGLTLRERGQPVDASSLRVRLSLPSDRAFRGRDSALRHFEAPPLPASTQIYWRQAMLDVAVSYPLSEAAGAGTLALDVAMRHLGATTRVELLLVDRGGEEHVLVFNGDIENLALTPSWTRVAGDFFSDGFLHILAGFDHLLFLLCLILPLRRLRPVVLAVTAFTIAHSITLGASALGWVPGALWFPSAIESIIAMSIVFMAAENALRTQFQWRWVTAFVFGLAHGFGFASAVRESLQFAQGQALLALGSFNLGVEAGQLAVLTLLLPLVTVLLKRAESERVAVLVISLFVAHTGWHWMTERLDTLRGYFF